ncbi:hypothetical protein WJX74_001228 [Apatococcus lobatus]|uniref:Uncharacterized protein n=1 Tax=Apatococcus lobatus TaxID=904363 RepID=A0AAW1R084_9CHLO
MQARMIVSVDNVTIQLDDADTARLAAIVADDNPAMLSKTAAQALHHVMDICAAESDRDPILLDVHVFVANKMMEDEGAPIDRKSIEMLLTAWKKAESSLQPDARKALRLVAPICTMVLKAKDKQAFDRQFDGQLGLRLGSSKVTNFLRMYVEAIQGWQGGTAPPPGAKAHYLENMVHHVYRSIVCRVQEDKGEVFVKKRLAAAKDTLDSYLFE